MRLCEVLPKAKEAISNGTLSLSTAARLQVHFKKEKESYKTIEAKEELFCAVEGKSERECARILSPKQEGVRLHLVVDDEAMEDLKRLSELLAIPLNRPEQLIKKIASVALRTLDPTQRKVRMPGATASAPKLITSRLISPKHRPYTSVLTKKDVWTKNESRCVYVDPVTKRRCESRFGLQMDHIIPVSCGGLSTLENLRLLCFGHHRLVTQRVFGKEKIESFYTKL